MTKGEEITPVLPVSGNDPTVTFSLNLPGISTSATRGMSEVDESDVQTVDVLLFNNDGSNNRIYYGRVPGTSIDNTPGNTKSFTARIPVGDHNNFDITIVANGRQSVVAAGLVPGEAKLAALGKLSHSMPADTKWTTQIPMWGEAKDVTVNAATDLSGANAVKMTRMVARIDVRLSKLAASGSDNPSAPWNNSNFKLQSVRLYNYNTKGTIAPDLAAGWDASQSRATAPHQPAGGWGQMLYNAHQPLEYGAADQHSSARFLPDSLVRAIYTLEAPMGSASTLTTNTCLVIGGNYNGSPTPSYYRVDFAVKNQQSQQWDYLNLLRNHQYVVNINKITGAGFDTPDDAFNSQPVNIDVGILEWNEADMGNIIVSGENHITVNKGVYEESYPAGGATLTVRTNVTSWTARVCDANGAPLSDKWLKIDSADDAASTVADTDVNFALTWSANSAGLREAYVFIEAGKLLYKVKVTQESEPKDYILYFADNGELSLGRWGREITHTHQIAYFKFGSVVGAMIGTHPGAYWNSSQIKFSPREQYIYNAAGDKQAIGANYTLEVSQRPLHIISGWEAPYVPGYNSNTDTAYGTNGQDLNMNNEAGSYHNSKVLWGKGDPCRLVGLSTAEARALSDADLINYDSGWRTPSKQDYIDFLGTTSSMSPEYVFGEGNFICNYTNTDILSTDPDYGVMIFPKSGNAKLPTASDLSELGQTSDGQGEVGRFGTSTMGSGAGNTASFIFDKWGGPGYDLPTADVTYSYYSVFRARPIRCVSAASHKMPNPAPKPIVPKSYDGAYVLYFAKNAEGTDYARDGVLRVGRWGTPTEIAAGTAQVSRVDQVALFRNGGVVGLSNPLYTKHMTDNDYWSVDDVLFNPSSEVTLTTDFDSSVPYQGSAVPQITHTVAGIKAGMGDPCRLAGYSAAEIRAMLDANELPDNKTWKVPSSQDWYDFIGTTGTPVYDGLGVEVGTSIALSASYFTSGSIDTTGKITLTPDLSTPRLGKWTTMGHIIGPKIGLARFPHSNATLPAPGIRFGGDGQQHLLGHETFYMTSDLSGVLFYERSFSLMTDAKAVDFAVPVRCTPQQ